MGIEDEDYYIQKRDITALKKLIKDIKPDVVHLHTLMGLPKEFLEYLHTNKIKTVYTTHDFYGLCPKMLKKIPKRNLRHLNVHMIVCYVMLAHHIKRFL